MTKIFAKIDTIKNIVIDNIIIADSDCLDKNQQFSETIGKNFCLKMCGGDLWLHTSYDPTHKRKRFGSVGSIYDPEKDIFITPKPYPSWILNQDTLEWESPVPKPQDFCNWLEDEQRWTTRLETSKKLKKQEVENQKQIKLKEDFQKEINGVIYNFQCDLESKLSMVAIAALTDSSVPLDQVIVAGWWTRENSRVSLTKGDLLSLGESIAARTQYIIDQSRYKKNLIDAMNSVVEVESYDINQVI